MLHTLRVCFCGFLCFIGVFIQQIKAQNLPEKLNSFLQKHAPDRLNMVTNKSYYLAGDTVFFRVNTFQNTSDNLIDVQLLTPETGKTKTTKLLLKDGHQVSYITLPAESVSGDYIIRAFSLLGWESSAVIRVYNLNLQTADYKVWNWADSSIGPQIFVTKQANTWEIAWNLSQSIANQKGWLLIIGSNQVYYSQEVDLSALNNKVSAPLNAITYNQAQIILALNTGEIISHYTLRSTENTANPIQLNLNKIIYNNREPVELQIVAGSNTLKPENKIMAVRVLEQTSYLAESYGSGEKQNEGIYLEKSLPFMNLKKILTSTSSEDDYNFVLKGTLVTALDNKPMANSLIHLLVPATSQMEVLYSDKQGHFQVELDPFEETKPIIFRAIQDGVEIKNVSFIPDSTRNVMSWQLSYTSQEFTATQRELTTRLGNLNRINKAFYAHTAFESDNSSNYLKPGAFQENKLKPTTSYDLSKYEKFSNVTEIFRELIPAVEVVKRKDGVHARLYARLIKKFYNLYPLFLIDGFPTYDVETILNIPANQLVKIDVFNTSTALAPFDVLSTGGVIALYTKDRNFNPAVLHDNLLEYAGTAPAYVLPKIKTPEPTTPNFNPLVYWNPMVKSDENGSAAISFLTNDQVGSFVIELITLNEKGELITTTKNFTVATQK